MSGQELTQQDVHRARSAIAPWIRRSPLVPSAALSRRTGARIFLKLETLQDTGSFKIRGATSHLAQMSEDQRCRGVVTVSSGNHGPAVALAATRLGVRAVVCLSHLVPANKRENVERHGGEIRIAGRSFDEAAEEAERLSAAEGLVPVPAFDDAQVIAGQGTIGRELLEDLPDLDTVVVPLSGGGLIGGIALALKAASRSIRVVGVSMERGAAMIESQRAGRPVQVEELSTLADALGGGIGLENRYTFALVRDAVDDLVTVNEAEIADGIRHAFREERQIVEGAGAVGMAALLAGRVADIGGTVAVVVSGRNIDIDQLLKIVTE